jgi:osmotically-inducible protein OsmY
MIPTTDEMIKQEIIDQMAWDDHVDANDIFVHVQDSIVRLEGTVPSYAAKLSAEKDANSIGDVISVENMLEVKLPPEITQPSDAVINRDVESKIRSDSRIKTSNLKVSTKDGVVTLSGEVDTYWQRRVAQDIAASSDGVILVENKLLVTLIKSAADAEIETAIKNACKRNALIDGDKIDVKVHKGIVLLRGKVPNNLVKQEVNDIVIFTSGIIDIVDEMTVG